MASEILLYLERCIAHKDYANFSYMFFKNFLRVIYYTLTIFDSFEI
jgi:hypothetical protein